MAREEFKYGKLVAGEVYFIHRVNVGAGTYNAGDLLVTTDGKTYEKATAVTLGGHYTVVAHTAELEEAGEVVCYKEGYFNKNIFTVNGATASENDVEILKTNRIFVTTVKED